MHACTGSHCRYIKLCNEATWSHALIHVTHTYVHTHTGVGYPIAHRTYRYKTSSPRAVKPLGGEEDIQLVKMAQKNMGKSESCVNIDLWPGG